MFRLEFVGIVLLICTHIFAKRHDFYDPYKQDNYQRYHQSNYDDERMIKEVQVKQGRLRGFVTQPKTNPRLQQVDVFLGKSSVE